MLRGWLSRIDSNDQEKRNWKWIDLELLERVKNDALYDRAFQCIAGGDAKQLQAQGR